MVLKRAKCDFNGVNIAIFAINRKNHRAAGDSAPFVTRLSCNGLFSTESKLDNFCSKTFTFGSSPLSFSKTLVALLVPFTPADIFFKRLYRLHTN